MSRRDERRDARERQEAADRVNRVIGYFTVHVNCGPESTVENLVQRLGELGFDPKCEEDLLLSTAARLASVLLQIQAAHAHVEHGCDLTPAETLAAYATKTAGLRL